MLEVKILISISLIFLFITIIVQLIVMSEFATKGDDIAKLEQRRVELTNENLKLMKEIAEARNLDYIKKKGEERGYVALNIDELEYIVLENK